jgi:hypothetical protein
MGLAAATGAGVALTAGKDASAGVPPPEDIFLIGDSVRIGGYAMLPNGDLILDGMGNPIYEGEKGYQYHLEMMAPEYNFVSLLNMYGDPQSTNGTPYVLNHMTDILAAYPPSPGKKILMNTGLWDASINVLNTPLNVYESRIRQITNEFKNVHGYDVRWLATHAVDNRRFPVTSYRVSLQNEKVHEMGDDLDVPVFITQYMQRIQNWQWEPLGAHFTIPSNAQMAAAIHTFINGW